MDVNATKGQQWEDMAMEEGFTIWFCSSTQGCWTVALDGWAETPSWRACLVFVNGVWTTNLDKYMSWMAGSWQGEHCSSFWVGSSWFHRQDAKESMVNGLCFSQDGYSHPKKMVVILISFTKGCSGICEPLGRYGHANWDMLSRVWYSRKGFLARKTGPVLWNDGF